jgi:hypothetical protein
LARTRRSGSTGRRQVGIALLVGSVAGCESGSSSPPLAGRELGGTYSGPVTGASEDGALEAVLTVSIEHEDGQLSGAYSIRGSITFGELAANIEGEGSHTGAVFPGDPAPLYLEIRNGLCPDHVSELGGRFHRGTGLLELGGALDVLGPDCSVLASYQSWAYLGA